RGASRERDERKRQLAMGEAGQLRGPGRLLRRGVHAVGLDAHADARADRDVALEYAETFRAEGRRKSGRKGGVERRRAAVTARAERRDGNDGGVVPYPHGSSDWGRRRA